MVFFFPKNVELILNFKQKKNPQSFRLRINLKFIVEYKIQRNMEYFLFLCRNYTIRSVHFMSESHQNLNQAH